MKRRDVKSSCPINYTMEIFGDPWSMLIVRGMATYGAKHFGDFLRSEEHIGTSVLTEKLVHLESKGIITKHVDEDDKRKFSYTLTETGLSVIPLLYDIAIWGTKTSPAPKMPEAWFASLKFERKVVLKAWNHALKSGSAFFVGPDSVINQLGL